MSLDVNFGTELTIMECDYCKDIITIDSFTLSGRLNDYWGTYDLFTTDYNQKLTEQKDNMVFDTYQFSRNKVEQKLQECMSKNLGNDAENFLKRMLKEQSDIFYIDIF